MLEFAKRPPASLADIFEESAARRGITRVIVEKDFWVCYTLLQLFTAPELKDHLVFKGGTSLSKAFGIIKRFSEDIDLSVDPAWLGITRETDPDQAASRTQREKRWKKLEGVCIEAVKTRVLPVLEERLNQALGEPTRGAAHLEYKIDPGTDSPVVNFLYPTTMTDGGYIEAAVKLEFGALTDQRPTGSHPIAPWVAEDFPKLFATTSTSAVVLEAERTFWEKATILHSEYHRPAGKPMRSRHSRDLYDLVALANHEAGKRAIQDHALLKRVVDFKDRYFRSSWSSFEAARPGTFRIVPPDHRLAELRADYRQMRPMFLEAPPAFDELIEELRKIEGRINSK
ncbi:nucleotidyl transferase AbiEii/AbiGii toxin family protein [bacterium]|nr:nucleotidyl transferase AbiEii/AbiGii toxin family protein [bacterium]